jgi:O-acetyl-ADP-ribose deacetylase (regulator of RNase III)
VLAEAAKKIETMLADITVEHVDAIVNAANPYLTNGSGVAAAIRIAAGPGFQEDCDRLAMTAPVAIGEAVVTGAYALPCAKVIHTVGPVYGESGGRDAELLAAAHRQSLELARSLELRTVAFPAISTGIFGYPVTEAAPVALRAVAEALVDLPELELVRFCLFSESDLEVYASALAELESL